MEKCNFDVTEFLMETELAKSRKGAVLMEFNHRFFVHAPDHTIDAATFVPNINLPGVREYLERTDRFEPVSWCPASATSARCRNTCARVSVTKMRMTRRTYVRKRGAVHRACRVTQALLASQVAARQRSIAMRIKLATVIRTM
jgi:hypothetical protein